MFHPYKIGARRHTTPVAVMRITYEMHGLLSHPGMVEKEPHRRLAAIIGDNKICSEY